MNQVKKKPRPLSVASDERKGFRGERIYYNTISSG